jgi:predicted Zn-dependent protease
VGFLKLLGKVFIVFLCFVIIFFISALFITKFKSDSLLGSWLREKIIHYPLLITLTDINQPGDFQIYYLDPKRDEIVTTIYYTKSSKPSDEIELWIKDMIFETTGKRTENRKILLENTQEQEQYSNEELEEVRKGIVDKFDTQIKLHIIYLTKRKEQPTNVGLTLHRDTIFVFSDSLKDLSERKYVKDRLEKSTIMHEWGHLLGLGHSDNLNCIMSSLVEVQDQFFLAGKEIAVDYCYETLLKLERRRENIK